MDMYKVKWTTLQAEIFTFLCIRAGQKFNLRNLSKQLKVSPTAVSNSLVKLEKEEVIKVEKSKTMNLMSIELNRNNPKTIQKKRVKNLELFYESGLFELLFNELPGCSIILFGSYSRGEDVLINAGEGYISDIDIAVIGTKGAEIDLERFEKKLERAININFYKSWNIDNNLKSNILNGIVLSGGIEL